MTSRFAIAHSSIPTTGTKNFTNAALNDDVAKAVFAILNHATALDTITAEMNMSVGWCSESLVQHAHVDAVLDNHGTTIANARSVAGGPTTLWKIIAGNDLSSNEEGFIDTGDLIANGFTASLDTAGAALLLSAGIWAGDGISSFASGHGGINGSEDSVAVTQTGAFFEADALIVLATNGTYGSAAHSFGIVTNEGGVLKQRCFLWSTESGDDPVVTKARLMTDRCAGLCDLSSNNSADFLASLECTAIASNGFTLTVRDGSAANYNSAVQVFAIKSDDWIFRLEDFEVPDNGDLSTVDAGVNLSSDGGVIGLISHLTSLDTEATDGSTGGFSEFIFDGTSQYSSSGSHEDAATTSTVAKCRHSDSVAVLDDEGTLDIDMALSAEGTGFSATISNNPASAVKGFALVFGPAVSGGVVLSDSLSVVDGSPIQ